MDHINIVLSDFCIIDSGGQSNIYLCKMTSSTYIEPVNVVAKDLANVKDEHVYLLYLYISLLFDYFYR